MDQTVKQNTYSTVSNNEVNIMNITTFRQASFFLIIILITILSSPQISKAEGVFDWFGSILEDEDTIEKKFHREFDVLDGVQLYIENTNGKVEIIPNETNGKVIVTAILTSRRGEKEFDKVKINININERKMFIESKYLKRNVKVNISYIIKIPKEIEIKNIETVNGNIRLEKVSGNMTISTVNGGIKMDKVSGIIRAETLNGSIRIKNTDGIKDISTTNGSISAEILEMNNDIEISTTNGSISIWLSNNLNANIEATTFNGRIKLNDNINMNIRKSNKRRLKGSFGDGTNTIEIDTTNGSINIYKL